MIERERLSTDSSVPLSPEDWFANRQNQHGLWYGGGRNIRRAGRVAANALTIPGRILRALDRGQEFIMGEEGIDVSALSERLDQRLTQIEEPWNRLAPHGLGRRGKVKS